MLVLIWVYDDVMTSGVCGPTGVLTAADHLAKTAGSTGADDRAPIRWRVEPPDMAKQLAVSERTLHRRFKQATGRSPLTDLQVLRVEIVKQLMDTGAHEFDAVSLRVGYSDPGALRQIF